MNWTQDKLREIKIFNPFGLLTRTGAKLIVSYLPKDEHDSSGWVIYGNGFYTDPEGAWYNNKTKHFPNWGRHDKETKLQAALAWCKEKYGIDEWEKAPFNSYLPKGSMKNLTPPLSMR